MSTATAVRPRIIDGDVWIPKVTELGWLILAKDGFKKSHERELLSDVGARAFSIPRAGIRAELMVERFLANKEGIMGHAGEPGPYLYAVHPTDLSKVDLP